MGPVAPQAAADDDVAETISDLSSLPLHLLSDPAASSDDVSDTVEPLAVLLVAVCKSWRSGSSSDHCPIFAEAFQGCLAAMGRFPHDLTVQYHVWAALKVLTLLHARSGERLLADVWPPGNAFEALLARTAATATLPLLARAEALTTLETPLHILGGPARLRALAAGGLDAAVQFLEACPPAKSRNARECKRELDGVPPAFLGVTALATLIDAQDTHPDRATADAAATALLDDATTRRLSAGLIRTIRGWPAEPDLQTHACLLPHPAAAFAQHRRRGGGGGGGGGWLLSGPRRSAAAPFRCGSPVQWAPSAHPRAAARRHRQRAAAGFGNL